ncbi:LuxR family two component transcriptional regulator [Geodermatophilus normandii]|uniref:LuxR family two component transcriptional regulator n=1 Tax=Geodermatophilus normandii TaxID=1137989 RepID=A0A317QGU0_9ACTN|nr:response regulator transcription factor [Geodermatophilus normandii]PWW22024.1 LuxR family two component transcriptional regulator [Geodermatophilus normandii]
MGEPEETVPRPRDVSRRAGPPARVLICDDHEVLRHGLRAVLRWAPDLAVVAEAADAGQALELATEQRPDVTLLGLGTQGPAMTELVRALTEAGTRVILLGEAGSGGDLVEALRAGARGYVYTTVSSDRLVEGVRAVVRGETLLDAAVTGELLHHLDGARTASAADEPGGRNALTARQQAVSELVAEGLTNAEIAARLEVSRATVKGHITVALRRLGLRDRTQLAIHVNRRTRPGAGWEVGPVRG